MEIPIFIWYENYLHTGEGYEGRVSRIAQPQSSSSSSSSSPYGLASLNLTRIRESDQGWYLCLVSFLNRSPRQDNKNATLFHLNVHGTVSILTKMYPTFGTAKAQTHIYHRAFVPIARTCWCTVGNRAGWKGRCRRPYSTQ